MKCFLFRGPGWSLLSVAVVLALGGASVRAEDNCEGEHLPWWKRLFIHRDRGAPFYGRGGPPHTFETAGYPDEISRCAYPSETCNYFGYYVGGGCTFKGGPPGPPGTPEGTYGWDYSGLVFHCKRLVLNFCHRCQGGPQGGSYRIDGPRTPDVAPCIEKIKEGPGHKTEHGEEIEEEHHVEHHAEPIKKSNGAATPH